MVISSMIDLGVETAKPAPVAPLQTPPISEIVPKVAVDAGADISALTKHMTKFQERNKLMTQKEEQYRAAATVSPTPFVTIQPLPGPRTDPEVSIDPTKPPAPAPPCKNDGSSRTACAPVQPITQYPPVPRESQRTPFQTEPPPPPVHPVTGEKITAEELEKVDDEKLAKAAEHERAMASAESIAKVQVNIDREARGRARDVEIAGQWKEHYQKRERVHQQNRISVPGTKEYEAARLRMEQAANAQMQMQLNASTQEGRQNATRLMRLQAMLKAQAAKAQNDAQAAAEAQVASNEKYSKAQKAATSANDAVQLGMHLISGDEKKAAALLLNVQAASITLNHTRAYLGRTKMQLSLKRATMQNYTAKLTHLHTRLQRLSLKKERTMKAETKMESHLEVAKSDEDNAASSNDDADEAYRDTVINAASTQEISQKEKIRSDDEHALSYAREKREKFEAKLEDLKTANTNALAKFNFVEASIRDNHAARQELQLKIPGIRAQISAAQHRLPGPQNALASAERAYSQLQQKINAGKENLVKKGETVDVAEELQYKASLQVNAAKEDASSTVAAARQLDSILAANNVSLKGMVSDAEYQEMQRGNFTEATPSVSNIETRGKMMLQNPLVDEMPQSSVASTQPDKVYTSESSVANMQFDKAWGYDPASVTLLEPG